MSSKVGLGQVFVVSVVAAGAALIGTDYDMQNKKLLEKLAEEPVVQTANILGDSLPERFYVVNGDTSYIEIDGVNIRNYFKKINSGGRK
jgi:hypothetical protein